MVYVDRWVSVGIRHYFEASYGLLTGSPEGRRFLHLAAPVPGVVAHGYTTAADLDAVVLVGSRSRSTGAPELS